MTQIKRPEPMAPIDLSVLFDDYKGRWVALDKYEPDFNVIASGYNVDSVYKRAVKKGCAAPVMLKVSKKLMQRIV
jgi:hypothetical protein